MKPRIRHGMIVARGEQTGVTVDDFMSCCSDEQTPVVWYGETAFEGITTEELTVVGPEKPVADFHKCGAGRDGECCIFLAAGRDGPSCERHGDLRYVLMFKTMHAKRHPLEKYPDCQIFVELAQRSS